MSSSDVSKESGPATCPVVRVDQFDEALRFDRNRSIVNAAEMFAAVHTDPVNGGINVREFLSGAVPFLDGPEHRDRRKMLNRLLRPDALEVIREDMILPAARDYLDRVLADPSADGVARADLVDLCHHTFLRFTAKLIGFIGMDSEEKVTRLSALAGPISAGTSSQFLDDRTAINNAALEAKAQYVDEFFMPALRHAKDLRDQIEAGTIDAADVPVNIMSLIADGADPGYRDQGKSVVETTMMFAAAVGTSTQAIIQTLDFLQDWFAAHPEDRELRTDETFLLNCLIETIRLRAPFSPYNTRMAAEDCEVAGHQLVAGQEVHIERVAANRDEEVFGRDAGEFNPHRADPSHGAQRYGIGFGSGPHQCFGLRVVLGLDGKGGAHLEVLKMLLEAGAEPDPAHPPVDLKKNMDKFSIENIPRYISYPVMFANLTRSA